MAAFEVKKAKRQRRPLKISLEGVSGSGKTYTMEGDAAHPGVTQRAVRHMFAAGAARCAARGLPPGHPLGYRFSLSVMEVYQERVRDLLVGVTPADLGEEDDDEGAGDGGALWRGPRFARHRLHQQ